MRILVATLGSRGDVEPFLWLARAAAADGHTVTLAAPDDPDLDFGGADVVSLDVSFADLTESLGGGAPLTTYRERIRPAMTRALSTLVEAAMAFEPEVIVAHPKLLTARVVAAHLGIPHLMVELTPTVTPTREFAASGVAHRSLGSIGNILSYRAVGLAAAMFRSELRAARERLGVPAGRTLPHPAASLVAVSPTLLPRPADWPATTHITGDWHGPDRVGVLTDDLLEFIELDGPLLYAGFGSMTGGDAARRAEAIVEGARLAGVRVLLATGWGGLEPPQRCLGPDVHVTRSVPHDAVMPHAAVALHHGGAGTVHAVTRAGVPSIVAPFLGDQPFWAAALRRLGLAGAPLHRDRLTPLIVRDAIGMAIDRRNAVRAAAAAMAGEHGTATALEIVIASA